MILVLSTLFCLHKSIDEVWDTETSNSGGRHAVLHYWPYSVLIELNRA